MREDDGTEEEDNNEELTEDEEELEPVKEDEDSQDALNASVHDMSINAEVRTIQFLFKQPFLESITEEDSQKRAKRQTRKNIRVKRSNSKEI